MFCLIFNLLIKIRIFVVAYFGGIWVYPILGLLSPFNRILFVIASILFGGVSYVVGESLNKAIWSRENVKHVKNN